MGNVMSEEQEAEFLEEGFDLDSPDADKVINYGTAEPNCQPKHTQTEDSKPPDPPPRPPIQTQHPVEQGTEVAMDEANMNDLTDPLSPKHRRDSNTSITTSEAGGADNAHAGKRQHVVSQKEQQQREKKMSYIQMAKLGYQELVNAIIRPPRADYKVCGS
jgi:hypothetical protein